MNLLSRLWPRRKRSTSSSARVRPELEALEARWVPATPQILSVSGGFTQGQPVQIGGNSFGVKEFAKPLVYADFENGLAPSSLGRLTAWDGIESMGASTEGYGGTRGAKATDGSGKWTMHVNSTAPYWTDNGQRFYIFKNVRQNFTITDDSQNYKIWRAWHEPTGTYPNIYIASSNGQINVEASSGSVRTGFYADKTVTRISTTDWMSQEVIVQASSGVGLKDGTLELRYDNQEVASGTIMTRPTASSDLMSLNYVVHGVIANAYLWNPAWSSQNRMWVDNVYVDTTWSRVVLGDASTYAACHTLALQPPSAWSDSGITVTAQTAGFATGSQAYLYVFDAAGNVNATGFAVTVGSVAPPLPSLTIDDVQVVEGSSGGTTPATFTVRLSAASSQPVTVAYATAGGTATAGSDYTAASGTLTFNPGETSKAVTIQVQGDTLDEADETFAVNLSSPTNATIADGQGVGAIINDDNAPSISINDVTVTEGNSGSTPAVFTVSLSAASGQAITVQVATANGTATEPADYTAVALTTLTFNPGETSKAVTIQVQGDTLDEADETFAVNLSSPTNATIADGQGVGAIINDDNAPTSAATKLAVAAVSASADDGNVPANTLDGDLNTRWSAKGDGQWIRYDLGAAILDRVEIAFYQGDQRTQAFEIQVSSDGASWTTAFSGQSSGTTSGLQSFDFSDAAVRQVRIVGHGNSQSEWNSLTEVAVWGWPPSKLAVAAVSASADDGNVPANTLDGDPNTRWSAKGDGQWIQYDLGAVATLDRVEIAFYLGDQRTQAFDIQVSVDGASWTTAFSGQSSGTTSGLQSFAFAGVSARYVRIVGHGNSQSDWNSLTEVAVWGWPRVI